MNRNTEKKKKNSKSTNVISNLSTGSGNFSSFLFSLQLQFVTKTVYGLTVKCMLKLATRSKIMFHDETNLFLFYLSFSFSLLFYKWQSSIGGHLPSIRNRGWEFGHICINAVMLFRTTFSNMFYKWNQSLFCADSFDEYYAGFFHVKLFPKSLNRRFDNLQITNMCNRLISYRIYPNIANERTAEKTKNWNRERRKNAQWNWMAF